MLLKVDQFKGRVQNDIEALIVDLQFLTGRYGEEEQAAWRASLDKLAQAFSSKALDSLHLFFGSRGHLSLEYQLPASSSWCDVVLLGQHESKPSAVIIELKNWQTRADRPGPVEGLMERQGKVVLHPSDQVRGYTEYCRRFHSAVHEYEASVSGCVLFTHDPFVNAYRQSPNDQLAFDYPCFTTSHNDINVVIPQFFETRLTEPDERFATAFEKGEYRQDRGFVSQIGAQILDPNSSPFELLDNQRKAFKLCKANIDFALFGEPSGPTKKVIIINGPPGSGKSVVAARLWASLVTDENLPDGSVVFTTTSASQSSNWSHLFRRVSRDKAGAGVVKKATGYTPVSTHRLGRLRRKYGADFLADAKNWREHLKLLRSLGEVFDDGAHDDQHLVTVVDEAHALINPEHTEGRGQFGFVGNLGPQAYHIIRASTISVFLLDPEQSFRDRENTTIDDIRSWAKELGAAVLEPISLEGSQFRCAGSKEYVDWLESVLAGKSAKENQLLARGWYSKSFSSGLPAEIYLKAAESDAPYKNPNNKRKSASNFEFQIFETPADMEEALRQRLDQDYTVRLLATYARDWKTRGAADPHCLPPEWMDFNEPYESNGKSAFWSKIWNYVPNGSDYTHFIQAVPGSRMHEDPLCEIGCPYAVRGFDFDYVGIVWLSDLKRLNSQWLVDKDYVFESGIQRTKSAATREEGLDGPINQELLKRVAQSYRILLTRAIKGAYLWVEDDETRRYLLECLGAN